MSKHSTERDIQVSLANLANSSCCEATRRSLVPTVSIISSFHNADEYFEQTYQSIARQTFQDFEWIITDDRSTDPHAIELFNTLDTRPLSIHLVRHSVNRGIAAGRNTAIDRATGKYLFFMDLDDLLDPTYLEKCVLFLETNPEFSIVNSYSIGFQSQSYFWSYGFNKIAEFIEQNWVTTMLLYRKEDFDRLGGFDENSRCYEDWERWLKAISNRQKCWTIPEYLHFYRRHDTGLLSTSRQDTERERQLTDTIKSRYKLFFQTECIRAAEPANTPAFAIDVVRERLAIKNHLKFDRASTKILCIFAGLEASESDKFNLALITDLIDRGYHITIATTTKSEHPWHDKFARITLNIFHLSNFLSESHWLAFFRYTIESRQIEIVFISHSDLAYYCLPLLKAEFPDVVFVDFTHSYDPSWLGGYPHRLSRFVRFLDCQIVASEDLAAVARTTSAAHLEHRIKVCDVHPENFNSPSPTALGATQYVATSVSGAASGERLEQIFSEAIQIHQTTKFPTIDLELAAELLTIALADLDRDRAIAALDNEKAQVEQHRDKLAVESQARERSLADLWHEQQSLVTERDALFQEKQLLVAERDALFREKQLLIPERDELFREKQQLATERDELFREKQLLVAERDELFREKQLLIPERDALFQEKQLLVAERDRLFRNREELP